MHRTAIDDTDHDRFVTLEEIEAHGLTADDVRLSCPQAVKYTGNEGKTGWFESELDGLRNGDKAP
jgi:hypothetical protein